MKHLFKPRYDEYRTVFDVIVGAFWVIYAIAVIAIIFGVLANPDVYGLTAAIAVVAIGFLVTIFMTTVLVLCSVMIDTRNLLAYQGRSEKRWAAPSSQRR